MKQHHKIILILAALAALFYLRGPDGGTNRATVEVVQ